MYSEGRYKLRIITLLTHIFLTTPSDTHAIITTLPTHCMDFGGVIPDVDIGMGECLLHGDPVLRVDLKHLHQQVSSMFGCKEGQ